MWFSVTKFKGVAIYMGTGLEKRLINEKCKHNIPLVFKEVNLILAVG